jgi:DUF971 family protein
MTVPAPSPHLPRSLRREGDFLLIEWSDGWVGRVSWKRLRDECPCAGCREEKNQPPDPFRLLKPSELVPLAPVSMPRVGNYAYKVIWSDGHNTGIYTLEHLRKLCEPVSSTQP